MIKMDRTLDLLFNCQGHSIVFCINDSFHWGCGDSCEINGRDLKHLVPLIEKYDFNAIIAYEALNRGYDPDDEVQSKSPEFYEAKKEIEDKLDLFEFLKKNVLQRNEEKELFNGEEVLYQDVKIRLKEYSVINVVAYVRSGERAIGKNKYCARQNLIEMWKEKNKFLTE